MLIQPWSIDFMIDELTNKIGDLAQQSWIKNKQGLDKLMALDAVFQDQLHVIQ